MERVTIVVSLVIFVIVVFTAVFKWAAYKERKQADRRKALQSFADSAGLSYSDSQVPLLGLLIGDERDPEGGALSRFHLLRLGRNDYFHNVVSSFTDTFDLHVSDYYYNNRTTGQQTYQE
jgi:hypothetical protein